MKLAIIVVFLGFAAQGVILQSSNVIPWSLDVVGVPGGIPNRTTIFTNMPLESTAADINAAIAACPSNSVVMLASGTYNITSKITFGAANSVTLRGAGMGQTIISGSVSYGPMVDSGQQSLSTYREITDSAAKGATSIVASSTTGVTVGAILVMSQNNDESIVWSRYESTNLLRQLASVTAVDSGSITFWPPLSYGLRSELTPYYQYQNNQPMRWSGIEDLTIHPTNPPTYNLWFAGTYACWIKNVESVDTGNVHFFLSRVLRNEVRGCYAHDTASANDGYGVELYNEATGILVEDNIFAQCWAGIMANQTSGSVFAYNFNTNSISGVFANQVGSMNMNHGPHGIMNLWEGNVSEQMQNDGYHGSTSHQTVFRNHIHGLHPTYTGNRKMIDLCRFSRWHSIVGNVLGASSWTPTSYTLTGTPSYADTQTIFRFGYPNMGNNAYNATNPPTNASEGGIDVEVEATVLIHGNFDYYNDAVVWDEGIVDQDLPDSLVHTSKPSWFGTLAWPPIGPDASPMAGIIPAQARFLGVDYTSDPPIIHGRQARAETVNVGTLTVQ